MVVSIAKFSNPIFYNYTYDQLSRLTAMDAWNGYSLTNNNWNGMTLLQDYKERVTYDANGNILKYLRNGISSNLTMDSLTYNYNRDAQGRLLNNQLRFVRDRVNNSTAHSSNYTTDAEDQAAGNYSYDAIGNLVSDAQEGITNIIWDPYGKVSEIGKEILLHRSCYQYSVYLRCPGRQNFKTGADEHRKYYSYLVCTKCWRKSNGSLYQYRNRRHLFGVYTQRTGTSPGGAERLGIIKRSVNVKGTFTPVNPQSFVRGNKIYEFVNHLDNVLLTLGDRKKARESGTPDGIADYFEEDIVSASDYYPYGMTMPGRDSVRHCTGMDSTGRRKAMM